MRTVVVIQTVQIHQTEQGRVLKLGFRYVGKSAARAVTAVIYAKLELGILYVALCYGIYVFHVHINT